MLCYHGAIGRGIFTKLSCPVFYQGKGNSLHLLDIALATRPLYIFKDFYRAIFLKSFIRDRQAVFFFKSAISIAYHWIWLDRAEDASSLPVQN